MKIKKSNEKQGVEP